jgi:hypothetical protein
MARQSDWSFTRPRRKSLKKAQRIHREMVALGKEVYNKRHKK